MIKSAVSDSTPLIHLAKISKLSFLEKFFDKLYITQEIFDEVITKGKELNKKEVVIIEKYISDNFIEVKNTQSDIAIPNLHIGERRSISLCREMGIKNILIDEKEGYDAAKLFGLKPLRTTALLLKLRNKNFLDQNEFKKALLELSDSGYFMSAEVYNKLMEGVKVKD